MAFWLIIKKAIQIKWAVSRLKRAKINAYRETKGLKRIYVWYETIFRAILGLIKYICLRACCWCLLYKRKNQLSVWDSLWTSGTLSNSIMISLTGLFCGLLLTHFTTLFLIFQLNISPSSAAFWTWLPGICFTFALAFSKTVRLFAFLTLPQFFTRKGRAAILGLAIALAISGPGKNTARNMEILTESMICTQEMAKNATAGLVRLVKDPMTAISKAMRSVVDSVLEAANHIKSGLMYLIQLIKSLVNIILFAYDWLKKIVEVCNDKVGTPFDRCWKAFDEAIEDCEYQLGSLLSWMCGVVDLFQTICYVTKIVDLLCWLPSLVKDVVFKPIKKLLKNFMDSVKTFFDVRIPLPTYKFDHSLIATKKFKEIIHDMKMEVFEELKWLLDYLDWIDLLVSLFVVLALYKAIIYRRRFLTMDRHDNFYITKGLVKLDWSRKKIGKQHIFPLPYRESILYVQPSSLAMIKNERKKLRNSLVMVTLAAVKILNYMILDVGLFLFLELLRKHGAIRIDTRNLLGYNIKITGTGFMADMYRGILKALSPIGGLLPVFDTTPCLPIPSPPDYIRYTILVCLILFCYLATLSEPYLMRLRHIICGMYYPERIAHRDRWLYTHILKSRGTFASYARSQVIARLGGDKTTYRVSLIDRLSHTIPGFRFLAAYFGVRKKQCFLCGKKGDIDDAENFFQCPICETIYCMECFNEIGKQCPAHSNLFDSSGEHSEEEPSESSDDGADSKPLISSARRISAKSEKVAASPYVKQNKLPTRKVLNEESIEIDSSNSLSSDSEEHESEPLLTHKTLESNYSSAKTAKLSPTIGFPNPQNISSKSSSSTSKSSDDNIRVAPPSGSSDSSSSSAVKVKRSQEKFKSTRNSNVQVQSTAVYDSISSSSSAVGTSISDSSVSKLSPVSRPILKIVPSSRSSSVTKFSIASEVSAHSSRRSSTTKSSISAENVTETFKELREKVSERALSSTEDSDSVSSSSDQNTQSSSDLPTEDKDANNFESKFVTRPSNKSLILSAKSSPYSLAVQSFVSQYYLKVPDSEKVKQKISASVPKRKVNPYMKKLELQLTKSEFKGHETGTSTFRKVSELTTGDSTSSSLLGKTESESTSDEVTSTSINSLARSKLGSVKSRYSECDVSANKKYDSDFIEEIDGLDEDGICHHHQSADEEALSNYDEVLSEMESHFSQDVSEESSLRSQDSMSSNSESDNEHNLSSTSNTQSSGCCGRNSIANTKSPEHSQSDEDESWDNCSIGQPLQRNVSSNVAAKIQHLDAFYLGMPYPPHTNTFKEEQLLKERKLHSLNNSKAQE